LYLASTGGNSWNNGDYGITPGNDTLALGNTYTKIIGGQGYFPGQPFAFRQVGNQLYGVVADSTSEFLIMDFDANVNDTIYNLYSEGFFYDAKVLAKDSVQVNGGIYHHFMQLEGIRINEQGIWSSYTWELTWNERALCGFNNTGWGEHYGGYWFNIPFNLYVISIPYAAPEYCTTDTLYNTPPNVSCINCVPETNSLEELHNSALNVIPNPATDIITLTTDALETCFVEIYDAKGTRHYKGYIHSGIHNIDVSQLEDGIYLVSMITKDNVITRRFIKQ
jgi:hypothetical protein